MNDKSASLLTGFASSVDGYEKIMASAFDVQCNLTVIFQYDWSHVQTVWSDRSDGDGIGLWHNDRPTNT